MTRAPLALVLALLTMAGARGHAQEADPMNSPECRTARAALEALLNDPGLARTQRDRQLVPARERAAIACLGRGRGGRERAGAPDPVQAMPAPVATPTPALAPPLTAAAPAPPAPIPRPTVITSCDPAGCWDSAGRRLNGTGPVLIGPAGACTVQGALAHCP
ncbi:MAG: hypothetical protein ACAH21_05505 [Ramlibacter sp.]